MDKVSFYRAFHVAIFVVCLLLHWPICVARETAEYYEDQYSARIRYSNLLVVFQMFIIVQGGFTADVVLPTFFLSRRERELIPDPEPLMLLVHFERRFWARTVRIVSIVCWQLFFVEWLGKDRDGVVRGGTPFLVVFIALKIYQIAFLHQEFRLL